MLFDYLLEEYIVTRYTVWRYNTSNSLSCQVDLTLAVQKILERITRCYTNSYYLVLRAKMILLAATGTNNAQVARRLDTTANTVGKWRSCWLATEADLLTAEAEGLTEEKLTALVEAMLADAGRSGIPDTFSPEQLVQFVG